MRGEVGWEKPEARKGGSDFGTVTVRRKEAVMSIIARGTKREFRPAPQGLHDAVCVDVIDRGMQSTAWGRTHKVELRWQIEAVNPDNAKRFLVTEWYTLSLHEKANLRHHLEGWRGIKFTQKEVKEGADLERLFGAGCQLQIVHNLGKDGETYANVQTVLPLKKGTARLAPLDYVRVRDRDEQVAAAAGERTGEAADAEEEEVFPF